MRTALHEIYDEVNTKLAPLVSSNAPIVNFTHNWVSVIQVEGPQSVISKLGDIRTQFISAYQELQGIIGRRPYYMNDIMTIVDDRGEMGEVNQALNHYVDALRALPEEPTADLVKLAISPRQEELEKSIEKYTDWISRFNTKMMLLRDELDKLMEG